MLGTRQVPAHARGRSILALSTLALLALCCLPAFADASSAGYQYQDAPPTATGKPPSESNLSPGSKSTSGVGSPAHKNGAAGTGSSAGHNGGGASTKNGGGSGSGNVNAQQGSQAKTGNGSAGNGELANSTEPGSSGGGSSPLVPILIAIVLLAAASVAYVMIRQRRRRASSGADDSPGSSVSPEAG
jgi:cobalamin biosynthesis Mg chelatase CobN